MTPVGVYNEMSQRKAYVITGPTSGIGRATTLKLATHGTVILVGRNPEKLRTLQDHLTQKGQHAASVVCDLSDLSSVRRAASEIVGLNIPLAGVLNNAGIMQIRPTKSAQGWDLTFATNHLGPFVLTEALLPHLPDRANILFVASAVEDPDRGPARMAGFRGARYISAEASARGEWKPGGSKNPGFDAYATSKLCTLVAALEFARENPRLYINAVEPGFNPTTSLGRSDAGALATFLMKSVIPPLFPLFLPFIKGMSTTRRAADLLTGILTDGSGATGTYYDEKGHPMFGSALARDPEFGKLVVTESRALLATLDQAA